MSTLACGKVQKMGTSQFFGLMIGYSGLTAYQAAENTVANNVANVETDGYSRQYTQRKASDALRTYTSYGMQGTGVTVTGIEQYRNIYFDNKYWSNNSDVGRYETHELYMSRIEKYFEDSSSVNGFSTIYNNFFSGLEELAKDPGQTTTRTAFLGTAQTMTEYFRTMSANLQNEQMSINAEIKTTVERINTIGEEIASLNKQINLIELKGTSANELRDKRALLVDELSKIVDVEVSEVPVLNEADNNKPTGANRYIVKISNGNTLVNTYDYNTLELVGREPDEKRNQCDVDGLYDIRWKETLSPFSVLADNLSGTLKSLIELRDGNNNEALSGLTGDATTATGSGTPTIIGHAGDTSFSMYKTAKPGTDLEREIADLDIPESGSITIGGHQYYYSGFEVEQVLNSGVPATDADGNWLYVYKFNNLTHVDSSGNKQPGLRGDLMTEQPVYVGQNVDYQGIPYYMSQMNQWLREFAYRFDDMEKQGEDLNGDPMDISFFQYKASDGTLSQLNEDYSSYSFSTSTTSLANYYFLTAENFYVNQDIIKDPRLMSTTVTDGDINTDSSDIVDKLLEIKDNKSVMEYRGCTSAEFLTCILSDISLNTMSSKTFKTNSSNIQAAIRNQRDSVSSVDDDEEALDLVKFQNAYNLNAKVIQTMTEIYDRLILQTGV